MPTSSGKFKRINEIAVPLWGIIVDTFDEDDLNDASMVLDDSDENDFGVDDSDDIDFGDDDEI